MKQKNKNIFHIINSVIVLIGIILSIQLDYLFVGTIIVGLFNIFFMQFMIDIGGKE